MVFDLEMIDVCVDEGDKAFFDVRITGLPEPDVRWQVSKVKNLADALS